MKKLYIILLLFASLSIRSLAQEDHLSFQYSMGLGVGNTNDFVNNYSFRGFSFEYKHFISSDLAAFGFDFNWNVLYEKKSYDTYTYGTASLSGTQYRSLNMLPFMATADYFFADSDHMLRPFAGLGVGPIHTIENVDMGLYRYNNKEWHFGLKPQVGLWYSLNETTKLSLSAEYLYAFKTKDTDSRKLMTFNVGFAFIPN